MSPSLLFLLITFAVLAAMIVATYRRDMRAARDRLRGRSKVVSSPYGDVEYAAGGSGTTVVIVHGAAGGWDQGALIAKAVLDTRFRWIAPSRFGYLRSTMPAAASVDDQAHAYAALLDRLGIDRVAVIAMSAGGPSALLFAALHPERVSSLTLLSCGVAAEASEQQARADRNARALVRLFASDARLWLLTRLFRKSLLGWMGVSAADALTLGPDELRWIDGIVETMHPASLRRLGVGFDHRMTLPGERIAAIAAPTLVVHARNDGLQLYGNAQFAAAKIPHAHLVSLQSGGHLAIIADRARVRGLVQRHILEHARERTEPRTSAA